MKKKIRVLLDIQIENIFTAVCKTTRKVKQALYQKIVSFAKYNNKKPPHFHEVV